uniref:Uncharacterized protein n=1 Tax=Pristionchus pacificus TaxID=54126 RepID=A0A2A6CGQ9_PRIPA|eukprot:PDM77404.1 hypothetical protein PRIPAC_33134 [Pristionchus pacificus]
MKKMKTSCQNFVRLSVLNVSSALETVVIACYTWNRIEYHDDIDDRIDYHNARKNDGSVQRMSTDPKFNR